jgi:hypothetical protein
MTSLSQLLGMLMLQSLSKKNTNEKGCRIEISGKLLRRMHVLIMCEINILALQEWVYEV